SPVRRRRIDDASSELRKSLQRVAQRRDLIRRRPLIDHRGPDSDDRKLLARRRNRALDQRAALIPERGGGERAGVRERQRGSRANADLESISARNRTIGGHQCSTVRGEWDLGFILI